MHDIIVAESNLVRDCHVGYKCICTASKVNLLLLSCQFELLNHDMGILYDCVIHHVPPVTIAICRISALQNIL